MSLWLIKVRTVFALGLPNIARAGWYRTGVKLGLNPARRLRAVMPAGQFFVASRTAPVSAPVVTAWREKAWLFSYWPIALQTVPPDWLANPLAQKRMPSPERPWWQIPDFDPDVGDIKLIWELSRMDWVLALAQRARQGEAGVLEQLNAWLADWCQHNPPYKGPNWKCGQEASIRVMHLACAALVLGQTHEALPQLRDLIALHLKRIVPTLQYAIAQDNNHGTSEAAALFIGGSWLSALGDARGAGWAERGRALLENRAARLIGDQGTFSQYSLNYHRMMLDTFSMAECWRRTLALPAFSAALQARMKLAARWLYTLTDAGTGDGPNVGANDGARLLQLADSSYRDFRPSVQLAMALFVGQRAYAAEGSWDYPLRWLGIEKPSEIADAPSSLQADDGGFMMMRRGGAMALLRYPRFRFRPSQADALHLDLWVKGECCLRDAGTYSYNTEPQWLDYFGGVAGHNTIQFDGREQMPRLSRFLLGDWLRAKKLEPLTVSARGVFAGAGYRDSAGAEHHRHVQLEDELLRVTDQIDGFSERAVLRWRLTPGEWRVERTGDSTIWSFDARNSNGHVLTVTADTAIQRCDIVQGWESLHYLEKTPVPVLELEVTRPGTLISEYHWTA